MRSDISAAASRANARSKISSGFRIPALMRYPAFAVITLVFPEPAPANTNVASSSDITDSRCSGVSGFFSKVSKKSDQISSCWISNLAMASARSFLGAEVKVLILSISLKASFPIASLFNFENSCSSRCCASTRIGSTRHAEGYRFGSLSSFIASMTRLSML